MLFTWSPLLATAQQQTTTTGGAATATPSLTTPLTPTPPLTPQEQQEQTRLQNVIASTTLNLEETQKQISGIVFTPRWSEPVWVNANSIAVLVAYCLPGEFAESGQEILGGFELEVLESYAIALPQGFMAWMAVVGNEDLQNGRRFPAALGVICASDLNNAETRVLSPEEQQEINNINQQFVNIQNTQITDIDNVINIINNVTANATGPVTPPPPPPADDTGDGGGTPPIQCRTGTFFNRTSGQCESIFPDVIGNTTIVQAPDTTPPVITGRTSRTFNYDELPGLCSKATDLCQAANGVRITYYYWAKDNVDGTATFFGPDAGLRQDEVGGDISLDCNPPSGSVFPVGTTTVQCTAVDQAGNVGTSSWTYTIVHEVEPLPPGEIPIGPREQLEEVPLPPTEPQPEPEQPPEPTPTPEPQPEPTPEPEPEPGPPPPQEGEQGEGEAGGGGGTDAESPSE